MTKEKSCLITSSLIGSVNWCINAPESIIRENKGGDGKTTWKEKADKDLFNQLSRVYGEMSEAAQRGIDFEKAVYKYANQPGKIPTSASNKFRFICQEVEGFLFYQKGNKTINVNGNECYLYVKYDAINLPIIKDIKTTDNYKQDKYLNGFQHKLYCYVAEEAKEFEYIIAEWDEYPKIKNIHREKYVVESIELLEKEVLSTIQETIMNLKDMNLWDLYREKFCLY